MLENLKLAGSLFFILFTFIFTNSAQTLKEEVSPEKEFKVSFTKVSRVKKETETNIFAKKYTSEKAESVETEKDDEQETEEPINWKLKRGSKSFTLEYGVSPFNPSNFAGPKSFNVYGRDLHLFSFRIGRVIGTKANITFDYMFGASPLAIFTGNEVVNPAFVSATATPNVAPTKRETTYGVAIQPINFKFIFFAKNRLKPYAQTGAGLLFANKAVPVPRATRLNFTGDFGGGLMYMLSAKRAVSLGYKYFHISNGKGLSNPRNPGYNANIFYFNYSFLFR